LTKLIQTIQNRYQNLDAAQKRRLALVCTGLFAMVLTLSVLISVESRNREIQRKIEFSEPERLFINSPILAGEFFLPDEPDFVPGVILQRERRTSWSEEDAAEFWQDPLRFGEETWREKIEAAIDEFLERIP